MTDQIYNYKVSPVDRYILSRDGNEILRGSEWECWRWIHSTTTMSVDEALRHHGYTIVPEEAEK